MRLRLLSRRCVLPQTTRVTRAVQIQFQRTTAMGVARSVNEKVFDCRSVDDVNPAPDRGLRPILDGSENQNLKSEAAVRIPTEDLPDDGAAASSNIQGQACMNA